MKTYKVKSVKRGKVTESGVFQSLHIAINEASKKVNEKCSVVTILSAESEGVNAGKYFLERIIK